MDVIRQANSMSEDNVGGVLVLCPYGMRVKVICDWSRGPVTLRDSREGPVVSGAAPLGDFRPLVLLFKPQSFKRKINNLLHNFTLFLTYIQSGGSKTQKCA